jgi:hypothetical protein
MQPPDVAALQSRLQTLIRLFDNVMRRAKV